MGEMGTGFEEHGPIAQVIDDNKQQKAGDPSGIGLPLKPMQFWGQGIEAFSLDDLIETAAMSHPEFADDIALEGAGGFTELAIEPHKQKGISDPHNSGDDVCPSHGEV